MVWRILFSNKSKVTLDGIELLEKLLFIKLFLRLVPLVANRIQVVDTVLGSSIADYILRFASHGITVLPPVRIVGLCG